MNLLNRRKFIGLTGLGSLVVLAGSIGSRLGIRDLGNTSGHHLDDGDDPQMGHMNQMAMPGVVGQVNHAFNGFNPTDLLTDFDPGVVSILPDGRTQHEYFFVAQNKNIELLPNLVYPAWTYNGRVPGPTIRVREGDHVRVNFTNSTEHPHTIYFHGIHPGNMDGVFEPVEPGGQFTYEFDAEPFGLHLYHCHIMPLAKHIAKGLYGAFIVEPAQGWPQVDHEFIMVMNGFDVDFDNTNEIYAVNTIPFHYDVNPIILK